MHMFHDALVPFAERREISMVKLNIKIKINEINELKPVIEYVKNLELSNSPELNSEITIKLGESESLADAIQNNIHKVMEKRLI